MFSWEDVRRIPFFFLQRGGVEAVVGDVLFAYIPQLSS